jgi:hypothetical protein
MESTPISSFDIGIVVSVDIQTPTPTDWEPVAIRLGVFIEKARAAGASIELNRPSWC